MRREASDRIRTTFIEEGQTMDFAYSDKVKALQAQLSAFMDEHIYPNEHRFGQEIEEHRGGQALDARPRSSRS